jgi:hypothetical protein
MAKMRCNSVNNPLLNQLEWEGTPQELLAIYDGLKQRANDNLQLGITITPKTTIVSSGTFASGKIRFKPSDEQELSSKMPTVDQLVSYILGKPRFEHDIVEVGKKFFGKQLKSRDYKKLYRQLRMNLETARKSIEVSQQGAFERKRTPDRNLPAYIFKRIHASPFDAAFNKS